MHPAYSVIVFTVASGAGYGMLALLGLVGAAHGQASSPAYGMTAMTLSLGLITMGLLSSTFHLGHPERAWRALSQWRTSWLSREGVAALATYVPALLFGLCWTGLLPAPAWIAPLGLAGALLALVTVFATGKIYASLPTIQAWHQPLTVPVYVLFALASGGTWLAAVTALFRPHPAFQIILTILLLLGTGALKFLYWRAIDGAGPRHTMGEATGLGRIGAVSQWEAPHTAANYVQTEMGYAVARKHALKLRRMVMALLGLAAAAMLAALAAPLLAILAALLATLAAVFERWLFFAEARHVVTLYYGKEAG
jgi:DMSO reductase anchor subunit